MFDFNNDDDDDDDLPDPENILRIEKMPFPPQDNSQTQDILSTYQLAHNSMTLFEPCAVCGARYYRGPTHIVKNGVGVLCDECSRFAIPLNRFREVYYTNLQYWFFEHPCVLNCGTIRIIAATQCFYKEGSTVENELPNETMNALHVLCKEMEETGCFVAHCIKAWINDFFLYTCFAANEVECNPLCRDTTSEIHDFINKNCIAFAKFDYFLIQCLVPEHPACPPLLRTLSEWRDL